MNKIKNGHMDLDQKISFPGPRPSTIYREWFLQPDQQATLNPLAPPEGPLPSPPQKPLANMKIIALLQERKYHPEGKTGFGQG